MCCIWSHLMICSLPLKGPCSGSPSKQGSSTLLGLIYSVFSSPAGLSMHCRTHEHWHLVTYCNWEIMHFLFKDPFASQFRFFSQVFTSPPGIVSIWGEGRVVGICNGGAEMDLLKMTSQQLPPLFQLTGLVLLSVSWQWNVNHWYWKNLKTPCETCPYLPHFDIIYLECHAACPEIHVVSTLQSLQLDKVLGVPLKFQRNITLWERKKGSQGLHWKLALL